MRYLPDFPEADPRIIGLLLKSHFLLEVGGFLLLQNGNHGSSVPMVSLRSPGSAFRIRISFSADSMDVRTLNLNNTLPARQQVQRNAPAQSRQTPAEFFDGGKKSLPVCQSSFQLFQARYQRRLQQHQNVALPVPLQ